MESVLASVEGASCWPGRKLITCHYILLDVLPWVRQIPFGLIRGRSLSECFLTYANTLTPEISSTVRPGATGVLTNRRFVEFMKFGDPFQKF